MDLKIKANHFIIFAVIITIGFNILEFAKIINYQSVPLYITYIFMLIPIIAGFIAIIILSLKRKIQFTYLKELLSGLLIFLLFLSMSLIKSKNVGQFTFSSLGESVRIVVPFCYCFLSVNFLSRKNIDFLMKLALISSWFAFVVDLFSQNIDLASIMKISFVNSYSPFENSEVAGLAFALTTYFIYFFKDNKFFSFFSVLLTFLCFKRVYVIGTILLIVCKLILKNNSIKITEKVSNVLATIGTIVIYFATKAYLFIMMPQNQMWTYEKLHLNIGDFSMGRSYRVAFLLNNNFISYGLGSSSQFLNTTFGSVYTISTLELDLIKIFLELGSIALIVFIFVYYNLSKRNAYSYLVMTISLLNLLMASGLTNYIEWYVILLTIDLIQCRRSDNIMTETR